MHGTQWYCLWKWIKFKEQWKIYLSFVRPFFDPLYNSLHFIRNLAEINSTVLFLHRFWNNTTLFWILNLSKNITSSSVVEEKRNIESSGKIFLDYREIPQIWCVHYDFDISNNVPNKFCRSPAGRLLHIK
jgi:hypothetical protein